MQIEGGVLNQACQGCSTRQFEAGVCCSTKQQVVQGCEVCALVRTVEAGVLDQAARGWCAQRWCPQTCSL